MDREIEIKMIKFVDMMVARYKQPTLVYQRIEDFIKYLSYTEALDERSGEFKKLFETNILSAVVEGKETTFENAYDCLIHKLPTVFSRYNNYSGRHFDFSGPVGVLYEKNENAQIFQQTELIRTGSSASSCGSSSSSSSCGTSSSSSGCGSSSSSSSCGSSSTSSSSCGSSYSYSSCGSSISRC